jgi:putative ABC transport system permease protein
MVFKPIAQEAPRSASVVVRRAAKTDLPRVVASIDERVAVGDAEAMEKRLGRMLAYPRFRATLLGVFAAFAVLLSAIGLYGVLGQYVMQRTPEIGIRMALGAQTSDVLQLIARQAGLPLVVGLALGIVGTFALSRLLANLLYGVRAGDLDSLVLVSVALVVIGAAATFLPARRAARVEPMTALRNE